MRFKTSLDVRDHEILEILRSKISWDQRYNEIWEIMKYVKSWGEIWDHEISEIVRWDMITDLMNLRYDIWFTESEVFLEAVGQTDGQTKGQL